MISRRVLVVKDDEVLEEVIKYVFLKDERHEWQVKGIRNRKDAFHEALSERPFLLITDIRLPKEKGKPAGKREGLELLNDLKNDERTRTIPVIVITELADPMLEDEVKALGATDFITRPFSEWRLKKAVNGILDSLLHGVGDLKDPFSLANRLRSAQDPLSQFLREQLSARTRELLEEYQVSGCPCESLLEALVHDINGVLLGCCIFSEECFKNVSLEEATQRLIAENPQYTDLVRLNRLLLQAALSDEVAKSRTLQQLE